jgi:hypothetical protein
MNTGWRKSQHEKSGDFRFFGSQAASALPACAPRTVSSPRTDKYQFLSLTQALSRVVQDFIRRVML